MWLNFFGLLPGNVLTLLLIATAFLRFYDQTDFQILGLIANPRQWSNGCTVAAIVATVVNFSVDWYRRNRETNRLAEEVQCRAEDEARRMAQESEERRREGRETRRLRIETQCHVAELQFLLDPSDENRLRLRVTLAVLDEYGGL